MFWSDHDEMTPKRVISRSPAASLAWRCAQPIFWRAPIYRQNIGIPAALIYDNLLIQIKQPYFFMIGDLQQNVNLESCADVETDSSLRMS